MGEKKRYMDFSRREWNGMLVLLLLVAGVWLYPMVCDALRRDSGEVAYESFITELEGEKKEASRPYDRETIREHSPTRSVAPTNLFSFDPNQASAAMFEKLGLNRGQIRNILHYRERGGHFAKKEDFQKLYTLSAADYTRLAPYIQIAKKENTSGSTSYSESNRQEEKGLPIVVALNEADSLSLLTLPGIGPVFAARILKYRDALGGFYALQQLMEVYGMDSVRFQQVLPHVVLGNPSLRSLAVNRLGIEELGKHPYIRYKRASVIVQYRKQHGAFSSLKDLADIRIFDAAYLQKIAPYLIFDL